MNPTIDHNLVKALAKAQGETEKAEVVAEYLAQMKAEFKSPYYQFKSGGWAVLALIGMVAWGGVQIYSINANISVVRESQELQRLEIKDIKSNNEKSTNLILEKLDKISK